MKIFCISGKARHGKDTTANIMKNEFEKLGKKVLIAHYGDLVKYICKTFFNWGGNKDEKGRSLLQYVGTDAIRSKEPDFWVNFIIQILSFFPNEWDYILIPDARFPNEIENLKRINGFDVEHIRVIRPNFISDLTEEQLKHPSETALDNFPFDQIIFNSGTIEELECLIRELVTSYI